MTRGELSPTELVDAFTRAQQTMTLAAALRHVIAENDRQRAAYASQGASPVLSEIARRFNTSTKDLLGRQWRTGHGHGAYRLARPRAIAWWLLHHRFGMSYPLLGDLFDGRDHSTVLKAVAELNAELKFNEVLRAQLADIEAAVWAAIERKAA